MHSKGSGQLEKINQEITKARRAHAEWKERVASMITSGDFCEDFQARDARLFGGTTEL
jgi:hypothetical protein